MNKFAFVIHPTSIRQIRKFWYLTKFLPAGAIKKITWNAPTREVSSVLVKSLTGEEAQGYFVVCPLLPEQMINNDERLVIDKITNAGRVAEKLGAQIVGLGGYTSVVGDKGETISKNLNIAVTTGNSYTTAAVIESVSKAAELMNIDLAQATASIIGATGSIGSTCARILAKSMAKMIINARNQKKLERLANDLKITNKSVTIVSEIEKAVEADVIIVTTSSPRTLIDVKWLKPRSIVCDVAVPKNVPQNGLITRNDILVFDGGLVKTPYKINFGFDLGIPSNLVYACMAETMVLALEGKFDNYSLGEFLSLEKVKEIHSLASKHGFNINEFNKFPISSSLNN